MYRVGRVAVASGAMGARTRVAAAVSDPEAPGTALVFTNCYHVPLTQLSTVVKQLLPRRTNAAAPLDCSFFMLKNRGNFVRRVRERPSFRNTIFLLIIVSDCFYIHFYHETDHKILLM